MRVAQFGRVFALVGHQPPNQSDATVEIDDGEAEGEDDHRGSRRFLSEVVDIVDDEIQNQKSDENGQNGRTRRPPKADQYEQSQPVDAKQREWPRSADVGQLFQAQQSHKQRRQSRPHQIRDVHGQGSSRRRPPRRRGH